MRVVSCSGIPWEPLMGLELTTDRHLLITRQTHYPKLGLPIKFNKTRQGFITPKGAIVFMLKHFISVKNVIKIILISLYLSQCLHTVSFPSPPCEYVHNLTKTKNSPSNKSNKEILMLFAVNRICWGNKLFQSTL